MFSSGLSSSTRNCAPFLTERFLCVVQSQALYPPSPLTQVALWRSFVEFSDLHSISRLTLSLSSVGVHFPHIYTARLSAESSRFFFPL